MKKYVIAILALIMGMPGLSFGMEYMLFDYFVKNCKKMPQLSFNQQDIKVKRLIEAIENNDIVLVQELIEKGADINRMINKTFTDYNISFYTTPLSRALDMHNYPIVMLLLGQPNIDVNKEVEGNTPLMLSIKRMANYRENNDILKLLLTHSKIDVNSLDSHGHTPLMQAIISQSHETLSLLLSHKKINLDDPALNKFIESNKEKYSEEIALIFEAIKKEKEKSILQMIKSEHSNPQSLFSHVPLDIIFLVLEQVLGREIKSEDKELYKSLPAIMPANPAPEDIEKLEFVRAALRAEVAKPTAADAAKG